MKAVLATLGAVLLAGALAAGGLVGGLYDISATDPHLAPTYWAIDTASRRSVKLRARSIEVPALGDAARVWNHRGRVPRRACPRTSGTGPDAGATWECPRDLSPSPRTVLG